MQVEALSNIDHDNQSYAKGDVIEVTEDQGKALIDAKVAKEVGSSDSSEEKPETPETETSEPEETKVAELPDSFTDGEDEYKVVRNTNGRVSRYELNGEKILKSEYQAAFETTQEVTEESEGEDQE